MWMRSMGNSVDGASGVSGPLPRTMIASAVAFSASEAADGGELERFAMMVRVTG